MCVCIYIYTHTYPGCKYLKAVSLEHTSKCQENSESSEILLKINTN